MLGPVEAVVDGRSLPLGARKQRAVLAMLVLEANRPVSADRLVEGVWGESPPASAGKMVQLYISQLRKALHGHDVTITTRARGYQLSCAAENVDLVRAERLVAAAAAADDAGSGHAREALALWRGPALADIADEPFAAAEIRRCDELWLQAKELAIDSDLAAGHNEDALREAMALAAEHPLREHAQAQLMLALYRTGRQADALEAYRAARARLVDQIGSEPGPELRHLQAAILHQSAALDAPARMRATERPAPRRPRGRRAGIVVAASLACAVIAVVAVRAWTGDSAITTIEEDSVALIDPASATVSPGYEVGRGPTAVATGAGSVWVANGLDATVSRIDRARGQVLPIDVRARPVALAFGAGSLWVAADDERIHQIDPASNRVVQRIPVGGQPSAVAVGYGWVWVAEPREGVVARIDLARRRDTQRLPAGAGPTALAIGAGAVWVTAEDSGQLVRLQPRSGLATAPINVGNGPAGIAVGAGAVWVANRTDGTISRVDPRTARVTGTFPVGIEAAAIAVADGDVWVADAAAGMIARVEPASGRVTKRLHVGSSPSALVATDGNLWATAGASPASHRGGRLVAESRFCRAECMDPGAAGGFPQGWETLTLVYDGLLGYPRLPGAAGEALVGALATSVPEPTDGGRTYVFTLRPGIRFSTGRPVRAADVRASIERAVLVGRESLPGFFANIVGAAACAETEAPCDLSRGIVTDERARTVMFRLRRPEPVFPYKLASVSASVVPAGTPAEPTLPPPPGTGPYRFASLDEHGAARLVRNPQFRSWSAAARPGGFADDIVVRRQTELQPTRDDARRSVAAVERGATDLTELTSGRSGLSAAERSGIVTRYPSRVAVAPRLGTAYMFLNVREPPFDNASVRQAVNFATDRARMVALAGGSAAAQPACNVIPTGVPETRPYCRYTSAPSALGAWTAPDVGAARRLIAASGTRGTRVRVWADADRARFGRYFAGLLHTLGYRTELRIVSLRDGFDYYDAISDPRTHAQIGIFGWDADYPSPATFFDPTFSCAGLAAEGSFNLSRFCSPALDRRAATALAADGTAAEDRWAVAGRELSALAPAVPLITRARSYFTSARVGNVQQSAMFGVMLERVWVR